MLAPWARDLFVPYPCRAVLGPSPTLACSVAVSSRAHGSLDLPLHGAGPAPCFHVDMWSRAQGSPSVAALGMRVGVAAAE